MITWLKNIPIAYKVLVSVVTIFGLGLTTGLTFISYAELPQRVTDNEHAIQNLAAQVKKSQEGIAEVYEEVKRGNCLAIADLKGEPYQKCLIN